MDDRTRLTQLYADHWRALLGYAARRCNTAADAADVVSEVFLVAWRRIGDVPHGDDARPWLFGVARLTLANQLRSDRRQDRLGATLLATLTDSPEFDPAELFHRSHRDNRVREALGSLPETDRELLTLVAWEQLTPAQAAAALGITAVAARTRLSRARKRLTTQMALLDEEPAPHGLERTSS